MAFSSAALRALKASLARAEAIPVHAAADEAATMRNHSRRVNSGGFVEVANSRGMLDNTHLKQSEKARRIRLLRNKPGDWIYDGH